MRAMTGCGHEREGWRSRGPTGSIPVVNEMLSILAANLLSPMVLAFVLGLMATLVKSDLKIPDQLYDGLSMYLLLAIGLKGGVALAQSTFREVAAPAVATLVLGVLVPFWCFIALRRWVRLDPTNAGAIAAHYGSVSAVTFMSCLAFLEKVGLPAEGFLPALVAILEAPAIVVGVSLARRHAAGDTFGSWKMLAHEICTGKSVVLLIGGLVIGWVSGPAGYAHVEPLFGAPFKGFLALFMLEMGIVAARRLGDIAQVGPRLLAFAIGAPMLNGALGVLLGDLAGLSVGGATAMGVMAASASYIAAPAAVRLALPTANPSLYLGCALAITFPFNVVLGIPLIHEFALILAR